MNLMLRLGASPTSSHLEAFCVYTYVPVGGPALFRNVIISGYCGVLQELRPVAPFFFF
jgi:hypothetical protein